jgi:hypothetical protein
MPSVYTIARRQISNSSSGKIEPITLLIEMSYMWKLETEDVVVQVPFMNCFKILLYFIRATLISWSFRGIFRETLFSRFWWPNIEQVHNISRKTSQQH